MSGTTSRPEPGCSECGRPATRSLGLEVIYSLAPDAWGRGYATEAARAVVEHALGPLGLPELLAEVDEGNEA